MLTLPATRARAARRHSSIARRWWAGMLATTLAATLGCSASSSPTTSKSLAKLAASEAESALRPAPIPKDAWPQWRGGDLQGRAPSGDWPLSWSRHEGIVWRTPAPSGNGSPIIWGRRIFLTGRENGQLCLVCLSFDSGRELWRRSVGPGEGPTHRRNGYASATPATDGRLVFAALGDALRAWDFDGQLVWQCDLGPVSHRWGVASSPVVADGLVIQLCDGREPSQLIAVEAATGRVRWRTPRGGEGGWTTPAVVRDGAGTARQLVVNGTGAFTAKRGWSSPTIWRRGARFGTPRGRRTFPARRPWCTATGSLAVRAATARCWHCGCRKATPRRRRQLPGVGRAAGRRCPAACVWGSSFLCSVTAAC